MTFDWGHIRWSGWTDQLIRFGMDDIGGLAGVNVILERGLVEVMDLCCLKEIWNGDGDGDGQEIGIGPVTTQHIRSCTYDVYVVCIYYSIM